MLALIARVKNLLLMPGTEWDAIDREEVEPRRLALRYVAPLALIPTIAIIVALAVIGVQGVRAPILGVALSAFIFFVLTLVAVFAFAALINWLAPRFGAEKNYRQAFKLSAYSTTAALVAGVLAIAPALQVFALLAAAYSLYLLFVGAPKVMHPAPKSALNYAITTTFAAIIVAMIVGAAAMVAVAPNGNPFPSLSRLPFVDQLVSPESQAPAAPLPGATATPQTSGVTPQRPPGGDLRGVPPETIAGLSRVAVGVERSGQPGQRTVRLEAEYRDGGRMLTVQITYSHSIAQVIGFGGLSTSEFDRETADGYSRRRREGDAIVVEDWNIASQAGSYGRLTQDRFYVKASGRGVNPDDLRAAVGLFGDETLAQFADER